MKAGEEEERLRLGEKNNLVTAQTGGWGRVREARVGPGAQLVVHRVGTRMTEAEQSEGQLWAV